MNLYEIFIRVQVHTDSVTEADELAEYITNSIMADTNSNCLCKALHEVEIDDIYEIDEEEE